MRKAYYVVHDQTGRRYWNGHTWGLGLAQAKIYTNKVEAEWVASAIGGSWELLDHDNRAKLL